jgi:hypothetical protein
MVPRFSREESNRMKEGKKVSVCSSVLDIRTMTKNMGKKHKDIPYVILVHIICLSSRWLQSSRNMEKDLCEVWEIWWKNKYPDNFPKVKRLFLSSSPRIFQAHWVSHLHLGASNTLGKSRQSLPCHSSKHDYRFTHFRTLLVWSKLKKGSFGFSSGIIDFDELFAETPWFFGRFQQSACWPHSVSHEEKREPWEVSHTWTSEHQETMGEGWTRHSHDHCLYPHHSITVDARFSTKT